MVYRIEDSGRRVVRSGIEVGSLFPGSMCDDMTTITQ